MRGAFEENYSYILSSMSAESKLMDIIDNIIALITINPKTHNPIITQSILLSYNHEKTPTI